MNRNLYVIAGCNGAGKTTASYAILPGILNCKAFVNVDEIASEIIERRYVNGIKNLFNIYIPISDVVLLIDNSGGAYELIARKVNASPVEIINQTKFNQLQGIS
ncbi:MAG: hypothetical protein LBU42_01085 [Prevotellaceae bacterium]|jgi:predicted ABC-type ATPase|nr:hypothetical protein [Prevotellaceae bacterium]